MDDCSCTRRVEIQPAATPRLALQRVKEILLRPRVTFREPDLVSRVTIGTLQGFKELSLRLTLITGLLKPRLKRRVAIITINTRLTLRATKRPNVSPTRNLVIEDVTVTVIIRDDDVTRDTRVRRRIRQVSSRVNQANNVDALTVLTLLTRVTLQRVKEVLLTTRVALSQPDLIRAVTVFTLRPNTLTLTERVQDASDQDITLRCWLNERHRQLIQARET